MPNSQTEGGIDQHIQLSKEFADRVQRSTLNPTPSRHLNPDSYANPNLNLNPIPVLILNRHRNERIAINVYD